MVEEFTETIQNRFLIAATSFRDARVDSKNVDLIINAQPTRHALEQTALGIHSHFRLIKHTRKTKCESSYVHPVTMLSTKASRPDRLPLCPYHPFSKADLKIVRTMQTVRPTNLDCHVKCKQIIWALFQIVIKKTTPKRIKTVRRQELWMVMKILSLYKDLSEEKMVVRRPLWGASPVVTFCPWSPCYWWTQAWKHFLLITAGLHFSLVIFGSCSCHSTKQMP